MPIDAREHIAQVRVCLDAVQPRGHDQTEGYGRGVAAAFSDAVVAPPVPTAANLAAGGPRTER